MKKINILILILGALVLPFSSFAEEEVVIDSITAEQESTPIIIENDEKNSVTSKNQYFELELVRNSQNPLNKNIPYTLYITPKIDSDKTEILWEVPSTLIAKPSHKKFITLTKDQTYSFKANIKPQRQGTYDVAVNVIAWKHDVNFTNSVSSTITLSENLTIQPTDSTYIITLLLIILIGIILTAGVAFALYKISDKITKKIKIWLTPPY